MFVRSKDLVNTPRICRRGGLRSHVRTLRFTSLIEKEAEKAERLLESALGIKCKKVFEESHLEISVPLPAANLKDKAVEAQ